MFIYIYLYITKFIYTLGVMRAEAPGIKGSLGRPAIQLCPAPFYAKSRGGLSGSL